jgi:hypothetical protein
MVRKHEYSFGRSVLLLLRMSGKECFERLEALFAEVWNAFLRGWRHRLEISEVVC